MKKKNDIVLSGGLALAAGILAATIQDVRTAPAQSAVATGRITVDAAGPATPTPRTLYGIFYEEISHADIAAACALTFVVETQACPLDDVALPALRELTARCEALPEFQSVKQPFHVPQ